MFRRIVAPGIEIRQVQMGDAESIFALVERNREYLRPWLPWVDNTRSAEDVRQFISRVAIQFEANEGPNTAIWLDGAMVGNVGCHPIHWANRNCSIGYWLDAAQQGKGLMTRCCTALLDYLYNEAMLHRVEIRCGTGNQRSCGIPQRLGFIREGVFIEAEWVDRWIDLAVWGMLDRRWRELRSDSRPVTCDSCES